MREILFRGKRLDNGLWIEGCLRQYPNGHAGICCKQMQYTFQVDPETVGQYTGLKDKNGQRIFEGDVVRFEDEGFVVIGVVRFGSYASGGATFAGHEGFHLLWTNNDDLRKDIGFWAKMRPLTVVGNIHDNL